MGLQVGVCWQSEIDLSAFEAKILLGTTIMAKSRPQRTWRNRKYRRREKFDQIIIRNNNHRKCRLCFIHFLSATHQKLFINMCQSTDTTHLKKNAYSCSLYKKHVRRLKQSKGIKNTAYSWQHSGLCPTLDKIEIPRSTPRTQNLSGWQLEYGT